MKHGFVVLGKDDIFGEVSYGSYPTLSEAKAKYRWLMRSSTKLTEFERGYLRLVELVEHEILVDK